MTQQEIQVARAWLRWFNQVYVSVAGLEDDAVLNAFNPEPFREIPGEVPDANPGRDWSPELEDLRALIVSQSRGKPFDAAALEALLLTMDPPRPEIPRLFRETHANRALYDARNYPDGTFYLESDRNALYVTLSGVWTYLLGCYRDTLGNKPADLGATDAGFLFYATDYAHTWRWTGSAWEYAPGDRASGEFAYFMADPGTGWRLCDGATVTRTKSDATTASVTLPNETGGVYRKGGSYTGTVNVAVAATVSGTTDAVSAGTPAGTVSQPTFSGSAMGAHSHRTPIGAIGTALSVQTSLYGTTATTISPDIGITSASASGTTTFSMLNTEALSAGTPAGVVSQPTFAGSAMTTHGHTLTTATVTGGNPANLDLLPYFRL